MPPYGSITYDHKRGEMTLEWANEDEFLVWLAAKEHEKTIKLIEFSGGKPKRENTHQWDWKIPSMKTGCQCHLIVKQYPHTETILGKYEGQHNHALGDENLRFLRLSDNIWNLVMDTIHAGTDPKAIWGTINSTTGYWVKIPTRPSRYYPVEFNFEHTCWTEVAWSPHRGRWDVLRPTGPEYHCNILRSEVAHQDQWGPIDGAGDDSAPAPSEGSTEPTTTEDEVGDHLDMEEEQQRRRFEEIRINSLAAQAEQIAIRSPAAMATETRTYTEEENKLADALAERRMQNAHEEEAPPPLQPEERIIDPNTGHHVTLDKLANQRMYGPDLPDPPSNREQSRVWSYLARQ
ncbi:hypothetical protein BJY52DRAFT_1196649 [Lactarius psammicola]|nr:hypothetical protein BJY52DRAFT_1196649 [Lactarius psammicola]